MPRFDLAFTPYKRRVWRLIEGQYRAATVRIVDTDAEQQVLETLIEATKPPVPDACRHLDYRLWSPFRYGLYPKDSRFRRRGQTPGVWYGSENIVTALCESIWGTVAFYRASPDTALPRRPVEHTAIQAELETLFACDLAGPPMAGQGRWSERDDYSDCLALADDVRAAGGEVIRYMSVRDPGAGANLAVLACPAFARPRPTRQDRWKIMLTPARIRAHCTDNGERYMFDLSDDGLALA